VLFRGGKRYGKPLSVSRLPSKKIDLALKFLAEGMEWDNTAFRELEEQDEKDKKRMNLWKL
jgi:hypothetical protein